MSSHGQEFTLKRVILDTGSSGTVFSVDELSKIGLRPEGQDRLRKIHGIGGAEYVFTKHIERLSVGDLQITNFEIEVGAMQYYLEIDGIIGLDFLLRTQAIIDLARMEIYSTK